LDSSEQIYQLFDSLMQGFPVDSFLSWKIEPDTSKTFDFFDFARNTISETIHTAHRLVKSPTDQWSQCSTGNSASRHS
jgi:hypothetical protein